VRPFPLLLLRQGSRGPTGPVVSVLLPGPRDSQTLQQAKAYGLVDRSSVGGLNQCRTERQKVTARPH